MARDQVWLGTISEQKPGQRGTGSLSAGTPGFAPQGPWQPGSGRGPACVRVCGRGRFTPGSGRGHRGPSLCALQGGPAGSGAQRGHVGGDPDTAASRHRRGTSRAAPRPGSLPGHAFFRRRPESTRPPRRADLAASRVFARRKITREGPAQPAPESDLGSSSFVTHPFRGKKEPPLTCRPDVQAPPGPGPSPMGISHPSQGAAGRVSPPPTGAGAAASGTVHGLSQGGAGLPCRCPYGHPCPPWGRPPPRSSRPLNTALSPLGSWSRQKS